MIPDLSDADRGELRSFMARLDPASGALGYHEAQGFLFALACSPELVPPSEWIPRVLGTDYGDHLEDLAAAQRILPALMALYNEVTRGVVEGPAALPPDCRLRADPMANFEADAPVAGWSRGFATGWIWLEESWEEFLTDEVWDALSPLLAVLFTFASREKAQLFLDDPGVEAQSVEELAGDVAEMPGRNDPCPCGSGRKYKKCCGRMTH